MTENVKPVTLRVIRNEADKAHLLKAPKGRDLAFGYFEPENSLPYQYSVTPILEGRFAIVRVQSGVKGAEKPDWTEVHVVEAPHGRNPLFFAVDCTEHAMAIYKRKNTPRGPVPYLKVVRKNPKPS